MNSGRVRIYELSRELNLDNKDILAVCEQLNIIVKSHSSTITEGEAERIRAAAEKHSAPHHAGAHPTPNRATVEPHSGSLTHPKEQGTRPSPPKKQQILEIRKPIIRPSLPVDSTESANQPAQSGGAVAPTLPAVSSSLPTSQKLTAPPRPVRPRSGDSLATSPPVAPSPSRSGEPQIKSTLPPTAPQRSEPDRLTPITAEPAPQPVLSNRPVLRRSQPEQPQTLTATEETSSPLPAREAQVLASAPQRVSARGGQVAAKQQPVKPPAIVELRRPQLLRPDSTSPAQPSDTEVRIGGVEKPVKPTPATAEELLAAKSAVTPELRRPTLPRVSKRGKHWEEEEVDETPDFAEKASKVGVKGKRRLQPLDDIEDIEDIEDIIEDVEELDLDAVLDNGYRDNGRDTEAVQVSLSIARPPKPKSRPTQAKPPTTPAAAKSKKGAEDRSRTQGRRERRDQEAAIERPEKLVLTGGLTVQELATAMAIPESTIIKTLFFKGIAANINQALDVETAKMVAEEMEMPVEIAQEESEARKVTEMLDASDLENLQRRPPVVTIMGHVDHGKTTLLDSIRKTKVAAGEAGGITQHIGAYHVDVPQNGQVQQVVFLDTPGHEAFTAMRARGARVTDVAILVVAADDGVQPQTVEAISHAKAAGVPIVVAINKVDKIEAQPDRVKQELTEYGLVSEEWGGDTIMVPVSAITGENLDTLLEMILLVSEVEDLYANPDRPAKGTVIEAHLDKARGAVATLLVQNGTLRVGDILVAGSAIGKVRAMIDDRGQRVDVASPSFAVEVLGLGDVPAAGDEFEVYAEEKEARAIATSRLDQQRQSRLQQALSSRRVTLNTLSARAQEGELKELNLILKADVQGSLEAILNALKQLPQNEVQVRVLFAAPGEITETDVDLAAASDAVIVGFNTTFASGARQAADHTGVDVREYNIIYKLLDDIQAAMEGLLEPELVEEILGQAEVRAVFPVGRGMVAGSYIQSGKVIRNCKVRVLRKGQVIHEGTLDSLKRIKEDAREVNAGYECGMGVDNFNTWEIGDVIEAFRMVAKRRTLTPA